MFTYLLFYRNPGKDYRYHRGDRPMTMDTHQYHRRSGLSLLRLIFEGMKFLL